MKRIDWDDMPSRIRLSEFFPDAPQPGWPGRRRYMATRLAGTLLVAALFLLVLWLAVLTAGAVYPDLAA